MLANSDWKDMQKGKCREEAWIWCELYSSQWNELCHFDL